MFCLIRMKRKSQHPYLPLQANQEEVAGSNQTEPLLCREPAQQNSTPAGRRRPFLGQLGAEIHLLFRRIRKRKNKEDPEETTRNQTNKDNVSSSKGQTEIITGADNMPTSQEQQGATTDSDNMPNSQEQVGPTTGADNMPTSQEQVGATTDYDNLPNSREQAGPTTSKDNMPTSQEQVGPSSGADNMPTSQEQVEATTNSDNMPTSQEQVGPTTSADNMPTSQEQVGPTTGTDNMPTSQKQGEATTDSDNMPNSQEQVGPTTSADNMPTSQEEVGPTTSAENMPTSQEQVGPTTGTDNLPTSQKQGEATTDSDNMPNSQEHVGPTTSADNMPTSQEEVGPTTSADNMPTSQEQVGPTTDSDNITNSQEQVGATANSDNLPTSQNQVGAIAGSDNMPTSEEQVGPTASTDNIANNSADCADVPSTITRKTFEIPASLTLDTFKYHQILGEGACGKVFLASHPDIEEPVAVKSAGKALVPPDRLLIERQAQQLAEGCRFIPQLHGTFQTKDYLWYIMEYVNGGTLLKFISKMKPLDNNTIRFIAAEMLCAMQFLHSRGIIHNDINVKNVLIDGSGHVKILDFGMAEMETPHDGPVSQEMSDDRYRDYASFGRVLTLMSRGRRMNSDNEDDTQLQNFMATCRNKQKLSLGNVRQHPFLAQINWAELEAGRTSPPYEITMIPKIDRSLTTDVIDAECAEESKIQGFDFISDQWKDQHNN